MAASKWVVQKLQDLLLPAPDSPRVLEQLHHRHFLRYCSSQTHHIEGSSSCECAANAAFQIGSSPPLHGEKEMPLFLFVDGA
jgi:hypothetical protein